MKLSMICVIALVLVVAAVPAFAATQEQDQAACDKFCAFEWNEPEFKDACGDICMEAAVGESNDCSAGAGDSKKEKQLFWSACSFGLAVGKEQGCDGFCDSLSFSHHLSKFFDLACRHICNKIVTHRAENENLNCRRVCNKLFGVQACWRGCPYAKGMIAGLDLSEQV